METNSLDLKIEYRDVSSLKSAERNPRTHSAKQIRQIADSIRRFGFTNPVLIDDKDIIIAGHGRIQGAKLLGVEQVPTIRLDRMTEAERRAYMIADNKLAENAGWDSDLIALEHRRARGRLRPDAHRVGNTGDRSAVRAR